MFADPVAPAFTPRAPRFTPGQGAEVTCRTEPDGSDLVVVLLNFSLEGVGLLVSAPLGRGVQVYLDVSEPGSPGVRRIGTVRWCRHVYQDYYRVGIQLTPLPVSEKTQAPAVTATVPTAPSVAPPRAPAPTPAAPSSSDRRSANRCPARGSARVSCKKGRTGIGSDVALSLMDLSRTGLRLMVNSRLHPGDAVQLRLGGRGDSPTIQRTGTVRWCLKTDWSYCAGMGGMKVVKAQPAQDKGDDPPMAPLILVYGVALVGGLIVCLALSGKQRTIAAGLCAGAAVATLAIQTLVGFPVASDVEKSKDVLLAGLKGGGPGGGLGMPAGPGPKGNEVDLRVGYKPVFYIVWLVTLALPVGVLLSAKEEQLAARKHRPRQDAPDGGDTPADNPDQPFA